MPVKEDEEGGRENMQRSGFMHTAQKCIKLEGVDCQMLQKGQARGEGKMAPGYEITGEVSGHPGGLRSRALSCLLAVFEESSLRK